MGKSGHRAFSCAALTMVLRLEADIIVMFKKRLDRHRDMQGMVGYGSRAGREIRSTRHRVCMDIAGRRACSCAVFSVPCSPVTHQGPLGKTRGNKHR